MSPIRLGNQSTFGPSHGRWRMRNARRAVGVAMAIGCGAWACSSDDDGGGSAGAFYKEYASLVCEALETC